MRLAALGALVHLDDLRRALGLGRIARLDDHVIVALDVPVEAARVAARVGLVGEDLAKARGSQKSSGSA